MPSVRFCSVAVQAFLPAVPTGERAKTAKPGGRWSRLCDPRSVRDSLAQLTRWESAVGGSADGDGRGGDGDYGGGSWWWVVMLVVEVYAGNTN